MHARLITTLAVALGVVACGANDKPELITVADRVFVNAAVYTIFDGRTVYE